LLRGLTSEACLTFILALAAYITVGVLIDFVYLAFGGDEASRLADAFYVLYALDPHLASIGFIWNPLTSVGDLPFLVFWPLWHDLASHSFAASLQSAFAMAGAVYQLRASLAEAGVSRAPRLVLTALFALNPAIVYYAGNGMSEAMYLFTLLLTTRYLLRWLHDGRVRWLVLSGVALGLAYLARNEAAGAAIFGAAVVAIVSFSRAGGARRARVSTAITDMAIFVIPFMMSFFGWAIASYVILGQPFPQLTSQYGNSAQMRVAPGPEEGPLLARLSVELHAVLAFAPLLPIVLIVALLTARRHRDLRMLASVGILGGGLAFDMIGFLTNHIGWAMRYFITAVPLGLLLAGCALSGLSVPLRKPAGGASLARRPADAAIVSGRGKAARITLGWGAVASVTLALALGIPGIILTGQAMLFNPTMEYGTRMGFVLNLAAYREQPNEFSGVQIVDQYLEGLNLPNGSIIMDTFDACGPDIVLDASDPKIFMITADRAFKKTLAAPLLFHARYLLVAPDSGLWTLDAINSAYPTLYNTGAGFARLVHTFPDDVVCPTFRLYRVLGQGSPAAGLEGG
jgi:hypothetical protein